LSLHDALPISAGRGRAAAAWTRHLAGRARPPGRDRGPGAGAAPPRRNRAERDDLRPLLLPTSERALLRKGRRVALPDHRRYRRDRLMTTDDRLAEIRARAEEARQAAASGTTGTPPNVDGLSINDALDIFAESAAGVPALLEEVETLREGIATGDRMLNQAMLRAEGAEAEVEQ